MLDQFLTRVDFSRVYAHFFDTIVHVPIGLTGILYPAIYIQPMKMLGVGFRYTLKTSEVFPYLAVPFSRSPFLPLDYCIYYFYTHIASWPSVQQRNWPRPRQSSGFLETATRAISLETPFLK